MCSLFICVWGGGAGEVCPCFTAENWGQTLFKLGAWIKKGTDLHLNPITAFAKKMCESKKKVKKKCVYFLLKEVYNCFVALNFE